MGNTSPRRAALTVLKQWDKGTQFADTLINKVECEDHAFFNALVMGVLRNITLLDFWISKLRDGALQPENRWILRLGLYQLLKLKTPPHAAVNETVKLANLSGKSVVNAVMRRASNERDALIEEAKAQPPHVRYSLPQHLWQEWELRFGEEKTKALARWMNRPAEVIVRANRIKKGVDEVLASHPKASAIPFQESGSEWTPSKFGFYKFEGTPVELIKQGICYATDPSTSLACQMLDPQPGETVLDACAAPGGKTVLMAQMMQNRGNILATDKLLKRLPLIHENLEHFGVTNCGVLQCDWTGQPPIKDHQFDRILLDVPCSNTGVMRRRVDVRWRLELTDFRSLVEQQFTIVANSLPYLKSGGHLVYSTCSISARENENVVKRISESFPELELLRTQFLVPFQTGTDGAYAALFRKR